MLATVQTSSGRRVRVPQRTSRTRPRGHDCGAKQVNDNAGCRVSPRQSTGNRVRTYSLGKVMSEDVLTKELQPDPIDQPRRRLFATAGMTLAAAQLGVIASAAAQTGKAASKISAIKPGMNTSFKSL